MSSSANHQEASSMSANNQNAAAPQSAVVVVGNHRAPAPAPNLIEIQQRQQQELIKLLTQHFHNQFYQLANQGSCSSLNDSPLPAGGHPHPLLPTIEQQYQHQSRQQQRVLSSHQVPGAGPFLNAFDLHAMSLLASGLSQQQHQQQQHSFLQNRLMRSHQANNDPPSSVANLVGLPEAFCGLNFASMFQNNAQPGQFPPIPTTTPATTTATPAATDMSLFNALGLNLSTTTATTNNHQLVLSPQSTTTAIQQQQQQQQQAAAAALRLYQTNQTLNQHKHPSDGRSCRENGISGKPQQRVDTTNENRDQHDQQQDGFLKFSINTILGRSLSPAKSVNSTLDDTSRCEDDDRLAARIDESKSNDRAGNRRKLSSKLNSGNNSNPTNQLGSNEQFRLSGCDLTTMDYNESDSSSAVQTPLPQLGVGAFTTSTTTSSSSSSSSLPLHYSQPDQSAATSTTTTMGATLPPMAQLPSCAKYQTSADHATNSQQQQQHQATCHAPLFLSGAGAFPWTVAARGKPRRGMMRRAVFSDSQRVGLEKRFQLQKYISKPDRKKLAEKLGLRDSQVKIWFQNRRMKWRNSKERELLSAGGSREQTLPTRNNPNPDLSDVGETVKRLASVVSNNSSSNNSTISK